MKGRLLEIGFSLGYGFFKVQWPIWQPRTIFKTKTVPKYYLKKETQQIECVY